MKKTKFKQRVDNAVDAFFADEDSKENTSMSLADDASVRRIEPASVFSKDFHACIKILKRGFLFLPGAFLLFFLTAVFTGFLVLRPPLGAGHHLYFGFAVIAASALMTVFGLGDWRKPKHFLIPLAIAFMAAITGIAGSLSFGMEGFIYFIDNYAVYFFPLALIGAVLAKDLADKTDEK